MSSVLEFLQENKTYRCSNAECDSKNKVKISVKANRLGCTYSVVNDCTGKLEYKFYSPVYEELFPNFGNISGTCDFYCLRKSNKSRGIPVNEISKIGPSQKLVSPVGANPTLRHTGYDKYIPENDFPQGYSIRHPPPDTYKSTYGDVRTNNENGVLTVRPHNGWDFYAPMLSAVYAMADGFVTSTVDGPAPREGKAPGDKAGWRVRLQFSYDNTYYLAVYCHLDSVLVSGGQCVAAGAILGTVGDTGNADEKHPHLHLTVYKKGYEAPINPEELFGPWQRYVSSNDKTLTPPFSPLLDAPLPTGTPASPTMPSPPDIARA